MKLWWWNLRMPETKWEPWDTQYILCENRVAGDKVRNTVRTVTKIIIIRPGPSIRILESAIIYTIHIPIIYLHIDHYMIYTQIFYIYMILNDVCVHIFSSTCIQIFSTIWIACRSAQTLLEWYDHLSCGPMYGGTLMMLMNRWYLQGCFPHRGGQRDFILLWEGARTRQWIAKGDNMCV